MICGRGRKGFFFHKLKALPWPLMFIFLFLTVAISISGYFFYQKQKKDVFHQQITQLQAIVDLKAGDIRRWLGERLGDARLIAENRFLTAELLAFLRDRSPGPRLESIRNWMESLRKNYHIQNVMLLDRFGEVVLTLTSLNMAIGPEGQKLLETAYRRKKAALSDLHRSTMASYPHLDAAAPLLTANTVAGFVFMRFDPVQYLFPMLQSWPTPSPSAETLLVRREGDQVVFLNELRHRRNTALNLRLPLTSRELPAAMAVFGKTGAFAGRDYRGVAVWSVVGKIADSSWFIVAKVDREEIERPIRRSALAIFLIAFFLALATVLLILFLWQRQNTRSRLRQLETENQKQALLHHFDYLTRYANDIILLCDEKGNILEANERALVTYGYGQKALLKMNLHDLLVAEDKIKLAARMKQAEQKLGLIFETMHQRKDGSVFPVEASVRAIAVEDKKYFQSIIRDISERKQAESKLNKQIAELQRWHNVTLGREDRILDLKREVNELLGKAGQPPRYPSAEAKDKKEK